MEDPRIDIHPASLVHPESMETMASPDLLSRRMDLSQDPSAYSAINAFIIFTITNPLLPFPPKLFLYQKQARLVPASSTISKMLSNHRKPRVGKEGELTEAHQCIKLHQVVTHVFFFFSHPLPLHQEIPIRYNSLESLGWRIQKQKIKINKHRMELYRRGCSPRSRHAVWSLWTRTS